MKDKLKLIKLLIKLYKCPYNEEMMWIWNGIVYQKRMIENMKDGKAVG